MNTGLMPKLLQGKPKKVKKPAKKKSTKQIKPLGYK
jgi:hypothetical protein